MIPSVIRLSSIFLFEQIDAKKAEVAEQKAELKRAKAEAKSSRSQAADKSVERSNERRNEKSDLSFFRKVEQAEKKLERTEEALKKLELQAVDREENKDIALGTSKLNYLDPRISVAW